ncbi:MAG: hypothetical protein ACLPHI_20045 [Terriglobales bacterium]|jgi:hypothetical protein
MTRWTARERNDDELNHILSGEGEILPSSGFAASVMDAVRREAAAPPPIPFPWKRALPGLLAGVSAVALVLVAMVVAATHLGGTAVSPELALSSPSAVAFLFRENVRSVAGWTLLALLLTFVSLKLSMRLAAGEA